MKILFPFFIFILFISCQHKILAVKNNTDKTHAIRLLPGQDLRSSIQQYVVANNIVAGWIVTCVGSLRDYNIRFANQSNGETGTGHFEILSVSGTVSSKGSHLHISIADSTGKTLGGHLLEGCKIYTTAEIILVESAEFIFSREKDGSTPWEELKIEKR